ncbi:hypothetical protein NKJ81_28980 [Mesorhizobium sp. M0018]
MFTTVLTAKLADLVIVNIRHRIDTAHGAVPPIDEKRLNMPLIDIS